MSIGTDLELAEGSLILVTGVTGHVASTLALQLLSHEKKFSVRGTTRSKVKGEYLAGLFASKGFAKERFEFVVVEDIQEEAAWLPLVAGVDAIAHVASPFAMGKDLDPETLRAPAVNGTLAVLRAAAKEPKVKRVVITGSLSAVWMNGKAVGVEVDESDWNVVSPAKVADPNDPDRGFHAYFASKTASERAAWKFVEEEKPKFTLSVILPCHIIGPTIQYVAAQANLTSGLRRLLEWLQGKVEQVPYQDAPLFDYVDVRDVALLHSLCFTLPAATINGQRVIASSGPYTLSEASRVLQKLYPERKLPAPNSEEERKIKEKFSPLSNRKAVEVLGVKFRGLEESLKDTAKALLDLEKSWTSSA